MAKVSIIVPSRDPIFLKKTIDGIFEKATGDIEVITVLDGHWKIHDIDDRKNLIFLHRGDVRGLRDGINGAVNIAKGEFIMKCDEHCAFDRGFDETLKKDCDEDWVVIPRRYSLDTETWGIGNQEKVRDAHYLSHPTAFANDQLGFGMHIKDWFDRGERRKGVMIDDEMASQGSCWFMHKDYFKPLSSEGYGTFIQEFQEIGLRAWLTGGRVVVNKNTWYAHLWKGKRLGKGYTLTPSEIHQNKQGIIYSTDFWYNNRLPGRVHGLEWLIDKFWPVPTWPENWLDLKIDFPERKVLVQMPEIVTEKKTPWEVDFVVKKFNVTPGSKMPFGIKKYTREDMAKLFCELGYKVGVEIGVKKGEFSEIICQANPGVKLCCVDPWEPYDDYGDYTNPGQLEGYYPQAKDRLEKYGCQLVKKYSADAANDFDDNTIDFVYIDGNHRYEHVVADIVAWSKKVRTGGMISGHDYKIFWKYNPTTHVYEAVNGYTQAYRINPWFIFQTRIVDGGSGNKAGSFMWIKQ
jgi:hypothetical protein